jgi:tetraacyldisaccharide 4'-kinase
MGIRDKTFQTMIQEKSDSWGAVLQKSMIPFSLLYRGGIAVRSSLYDNGIFVSRKLTRPVGNMVAGGTGKTPLVIKVAQHLSSLGMRCAVLSRGYKGKAGQSVNIVSDCDQMYLSAEEAGDEPHLIASKLPGTPVLVGKDRYLLGCEAIQRFDPDFLILDDGYQHLALRRECNLLLLDSEAPFGNGWCLPAGTLREGPLAIKRANVIVLTGAPGGNVLREIRSLTPEAPIHTVQFIPGDVRKLPMDQAEDKIDLQGKRVLAFAGIARPGRFFRSVEKLGADLCVQKSFPDHHAYRLEEINSLARLGEEQKVDMLLTTEKDAVRLPGVPGTPPFYALQLMVKIPDQERFFNDMLRLIGK